MLVLGATGYAVQTPARGRLVGAIDMRPHAARLLLISAVACPSMTALNGCTTQPKADANTSSSGPIFIAHLGRANGDAEALAVIRHQFGVRNAGYDVAYFANTQDIDARAIHRLVFVQEESAGLRTVSCTVGGEQSETGGGDIILLHPGIELHVGQPLDFLVFETPVAFPADLPTFIRPDWDEQITDTPGGCATETGAYRRILLTWLRANGPYIYHALNAHRVRITDSFSHYHPIEGGFDEFYFVQMVQPNGRIIVSAQTARIEDPASVERAEIAGLLQEYRLEVGDLVYIPRGIVHRGVGGVLAQVITVPGFRPGAEIGVDHYLRKINESLGLTEAEALPFHEAASRAPVIR